MNGVPTIPCGIFGMMVFVQYLGWGRSLIPFFGESGDSWQTPAQ